MCHMQAHALFLYTKVGNVLLLHLSEMLCTRMCPMRGHKTLDTVPHCQMDTLTLSH
jgi:hypothetical protein